VDDPGSWLWGLFVAACIIFTLTFSALHMALRDIAWVKLEDAFSRHSRAEHADWIKARLVSLTFITVVLRMTANLALLLALVYRSIPRLDSNENSATRILLFDGMVALLILSLFSHAIPYAMAKYAGIKILVKGFSILKVLHPLGVVFAYLQWLANKMVRRFTVNGEETNGKEEKQEELMNVVEEQEKEGVVDEEEREMIESVLEFRDMTTGEIMTPRTDIIGIEADTSLSKLIDIIVSAGHSRYPIYEGSIDQIIGMVFAKDLLRQVGQIDAPADIRRLMRKPNFVSESKGLRDLLHYFQNKKSHFAVVLDEYGGTAGVVTIEDILEELVGEITDEYEGPQIEPFVKIDEQAYEIDARYHVDELNDKLELKIPEDEDYETIGGFAFAQLGHIPQTGEIFEHDNLKFTVIEAEQRRINRLKLTILTAPDATE
jgi:CBS domain containing-hemolysin-like protein